MVTSSIKCFLFENSLTTHTILYVVFKLLNICPKDIQIFCLLPFHNIFLFFINQIRTVYRKSGKTVAKVPSLIVINN